MNSTYKIIGRHPYNNRQVKKRVYTSSEDFLKYKDDLINRYIGYLNVEIYELIDGKWKLFWNIDYIGDSYRYENYKK